MGKSRDKGLCESPSADAEEKKLNSRPMPGTGQKVACSAATSKVTTATGM